MEIVREMEILNVKASSTTANAPNTVGKLLIGITGGIAIGLSVVCASFVSPAFRRICLPYIPATDQQVANVFEALKLTKIRTIPAKTTLIDLGSGDGRIVFEAAKRRYRASGVELNLWLVLYSKIQSYVNGTRELAHFHRRNLWKFNLSAYDNVVIFGVEQMMSELEGKLLRECKESCNVVACRFALPGLKPDMVVGSGVDTVWLYTIKSNIQSRQE